MRIQYLRNFQLSAIEEMVTKVNVKKRPYLKNLQLQHYIEDVLSSHRN
jgi:hypothetical protein